jgi:hypothetical protein
MSIEKQDGVMKGRGDVGRFDMDEFAVEEGGNWLVKGDVEPPKVNDTKPGTEEGLAAWGETNDLPRMPFFYVVNSKVQKTAFRRPASEQVQRSSGSS